MELFECVKSSLEKQSREQGKRLAPSSYKNYITYSLTWSKTIEGHLFWAILDNSYYLHGTYDYVTLVKLYHRYSRDVFKYDIFMSFYYIDYFDKGGNCLSDDGFELLCKYLEENGAVRVC